MYLRIKSNPLIWIMPYPVEKDCTVYVTFPIKWFFHDKYLFYEHFVCSAAIKYVFLALIKQENRNGSALIPSSLTAANKYFPSPLSRKNN